MPSKLLAALVAILLVPGTAHAVEGSLQLQLNTQSGEFESHVVTYDCGGETPIRVTYLNAAPNFLAIVPLAEQPEPLVFVALIAASGVRYGSGQWIWWSKGADASLYDTTLGEDAEPVLTCTEFTETP